MYTFKEDFALNNLQKLICYKTKSKHDWKNPRDLMANVLDCDTVVSEFELPSLYYVHFLTNALTKEKGRNPLAPSL